MDADEVAALDDLRTKLVGLAAPTARGVTWVIESATFGPDWGDPLVLILNVYPNHPDSPQRPSRWRLELDFGGDEAPLTDPIYRHALATTIWANVMEWWDTKGTSQALSIHRGIQI